MIDVLLTGLLFTAAPDVTCADVDTTHVQDIDTLSVGSITVRALRRKGVGGPDVICVKAATDPAREWVVQLDVELPVNSLYACSSSTLEHKEGSSGRQWAIAARSCEPGDALRTSLSTLEALMHSEGSKGRALPGESHGGRIILPLLAALDSTATYCVDYSLDLNRAQSVGATYYVSDGCQLRQVPSPRPGIHVRAFGAEDYITFFVDGGPAVVQRSPGEPDAYLVRWANAVQAALEDPAIRFPDGEVENGPLAGYAQFARAAAVLLAGNPPAHFDGIDAGRLRHWMVETALLNRQHPNIALRTECVGAIGGPRGWRHC